MNVKLGAGGVCFKITAQELEELKSGQPVRECLMLGGNGIGLSIHPVATDGEMSVSYSADVVRLCLSPAKVAELAGMGRSREGLAYNANGIDVALQVDFRTQKRKPGEQPRRKTAPE